eukprot:1969850-Alexandrium_andersonii.AAC.1
MQCACSEGHRLEPLLPQLAIWPKSWFGAPTPSWTRLQSEPRRRAERSSPGPGIRQRLEASQFQHSAIGREVLGSVGSV